MRRKKWSILATALILAGCAHGQDTEKTLYAFTGGSDGAMPVFGNLIFDSAGNLYGTTVSGGAYGYGTVFELSPSNGAWVESVLHSFTGQSDGAYPYAGLIMDANGALYGTAHSGGYGYGTVFELKPPGAGWKLSVLHTFAGYDGALPFGSLTFDSKGNLYGTTSSGSASAGNVFELKHTKTGWHEIVLYAFGTVAGSIGSVPIAPVVLDAKGNLYGTTSMGGTNAPYDGVAFELERLPGGGYTEIILHDFAGGSDGMSPGTGALLFNSKGKLYGTTTQGGSGSGCGSNGCGTVYELSRQSGGGWSETVLYSFTGGANANGAPEPGLTSDGAGHFYGTTNGGGTGGVGTVFKLSPSKGGWTESVQYAFTGGNDGANPESGVIMDGLGNLYGTTVYGGNQNCPNGVGCGVVYELTP
jgi:uncharacterized repeat protein (TIGR03803 family)